MPSSWSVGSASGEDSSVGTESSRARRPSGEESESVEWRGLTVESSQPVESVSDAIVVASPTAQLHTHRVQMMLVQLLQRAAHTPEELLLFVGELGNAGLLLPDVVTGLCRDAGVGVGMLSAIQSGASASATAASAAARLVGPSGAPASLFQALPGSSSKSLGGALALTLTLALVP